MELIGREVVRVRYVELGVEDEPQQPGWAADGFDALDYGVEIDLDDGTTWSVIWNPPDPERLNTVEGPLQPGAISAGACVAIWDVTARWHDLGPRRIAAVREGYLDGERDTFVLTDDEGRVAVITLGDAEYPSRRFTVSSDNLAVFFSLDAARAVEVSLPTA
jgi:hypothetical protein